MEAEAGILPKIEPALSYSPYIDETLLCLYPKLSRIDESKESA